MPPCCYRRQPCRPAGRDAKRERGLWTLERALATSSAREYNARARTRLTLTLSASSFLLQANLLRAFLGQLPAFEDFFNSEHSKALPFRRLALSLALFHAVVLERRKFGALGFNIPYEFTDGDFRICLSQLHMFLLEYHDVPVKVSVSGG